MGQCNIKNKEKLFISINIQRFATSGDIRTGTYKTSQFYFQWQRASYNSSENYSLINWQAGLYISGNDQWKSNAIRITGLWIAGEKLMENVTASYKYGPGTFQMGSGQKKIYHNNDGTGSFAMAMDGWLYGGHNLSTNTVWQTLDTIPRYATITSHYVESTSLYGAVIHWETNVNCDAHQYSLNGGNWVGASGWPAYSISGLSPNTYYTVKTRVKRTDSQLWTESGTLSFTTKDINRITSGNPNVNNGGTLNVTANSASGTRCLIALETPWIGFTQTHDYTTNTTFSSDEIMEIVKRMPNTNSTLIRTTAATFNGNNQAYWDWKDGYLTIINSNPTFANFTFEDTNATTVALTGNNQDCVIGYSNIKATVPVGSKAVARNYANMSSYRLIIGSKNVDATYSASSDVSMSINNVSTGTYYVKAIDTRGNVTSVEKQAHKIYNYFNVTKTDTGIAQRVNSSGEEQGVSEYCKITFNGKFWKQSFGAVDNVVSAKYRYKKTSENTFSDYINITLTTDDNGNYSFSNILRNDSNTVISFDIADVYIIEVVVSDKLSSTTYSMNLTAGKPHVAYAKNGVGIMGKYDTSVGGALQVGGKKVGLEAYPIGSLYFSWTSTSPAELFGGTWERLSGGYIYGAVNSSGTYTGSGTSTFGHTLTINETPSHNHTGTTAWAGEHRHSIVFDQTFAQGTNGLRTGIATEYWSDAYTAPSGNHQHTFTTDATGGGQAHSHEMSYIAAFTWRRTA